MFFWKKKNKKVDFNELYQQVKAKYHAEISQERKTELSDIIAKNGYYPSSFANCNLIESEIFFLIDEKCKNDKKFDDIFDIKIINLGGLSDFCEWLKQLIILPLGTSIYLTPFHKRDFEFSYLIKSMEIDENLKDNNFEISAKEQIQLFVYLAQKMGHKVFYDFLMRTSRYSQTVLEKPYLVRWIDTKEAEEKISVIVDETASELENQFGKEDAEIVKNIYHQESKGCLSEHYEKIYSVFESKIIEKKKEISKEMYKNENQIKLQKRVMGKDVKTLIKEGLWTVPCGADEEFGLPVFDYMNKEENYPVFKHFDKDGNDISQNVKDDFQTPAYFMDLDKKEINKKVLQHFIDMADKYAEDYNFDGFKINYTNELSEQNTNDKNPFEFLKKLNSEIQKHKVTLIADGNFENLKQYHDLGFNMIWTNGSHLSPMETVSKFDELANYNTRDLKSKNISAVKIYNDRFFETENINPSQLGYDGALFKWFCLNFLPSGKNAKTPIVYLDGDESYTQTGFAKTLYEHAILERNNDENFYKKFNAISDFARTSKIVNGGEANVVTEEDNGYVSWLISNEPLKELLLVVANYKQKDEKIILQNENNKIETYKENDAVVNKMISLPGECKVVSEYIFDGEKYTAKDYTLKGDLLEIEVLNPSDFRIFLLRK